MERTFMSGLRGQTTNKLFMMALIAMATLSACGKKKAKVGTEPEVPVAPAEPGDTAGQRDELGKRYCTIPMTTTLSTENWEARFSELFLWTVSGFENTPTFCGDLTGSGTSFTGAIMLEYEDDEGIGYLSLDEQFLFYGNLQRGTTNKMELIYNFSIDGTGFLLQLKGQSVGNAQNMETTIRFHQLASAQEQYNEQLASIQKKCKDGTWTVAQCLGYNFPPTFWWNDPSTYTTPNQQKLELARQLLASTSKSKELAKVKFKLSDVTN